MLKEITLPSFGSSIGEATIAQWLVAPGSVVEAGQVIAEIETDKAVAELEAPEAGVIESIDIAEGNDAVEVGTVLAYLRVVDDKSDMQSPVAPDTPPTPAEPRGRIPASPLARKLARERDIELRGIPGSGTDGRVVSRDLPPVGDRSSAPAASTLDASGHAPGSYELAPVSKMRRAIADGLTRSVRNIPGYSLTRDFEMDAILDHRAAANAAMQDGTAKISINDYVVWACARALQGVPAANSAWTDAGIARFRGANIAIAVAVDEGLVTPVIHGAESMTLQDIAAASGDAIHRARNRQLTTGDLSGATFTVSNLGMLGIGSFTSIPSENQACILSVGAVESRPLVRNGELSVARLATFTLTCDHRVVDGATGAAFLQHLSERLASLPD